MASRQGFLVNNIDPSKAQSSGVDVREGAVRITCANLGLPGAAWQVRVGTDKVGTWANVVRFGVPIILSDNNTQYVEAVSGQYRVAPVSLPGTAQVFFQEDEETDHDAKTTYVFGQENTNQNGITAGSTGSIQVNGNGTVAAPLSLDVIYANDGANLAYAGMDGGVDVNLNIANSPTIDLTGTGTTTAPLTAVVNISSDAGNNLSAHTDGLFASAPTPGSTTISVLDAATQITVSGGTVSDPENGVQILTNDKQTIYINNVYLSVATTSTSLDINTPLTLTYNSITYTCVASNVSLQNSAGSSNPTPFYGTIDHTNIIVADSDNYSISINLIYSA